MDMMLVERLTTLLLAECPDLGQTMNFLRLMGRDSSTDDGSRSHERSSYIDLTRIR